MFQLWCSVVMALAFCLPVPHAMMGTQPVSAIPVVERATIEFAQPQYDLGVVAARGLVTSSVEFTNTSEEAVTVEKVLICQKFMDSGVPIAVAAHETVRLSFEFTAEPFAVEKSVDFGVVLTNGAIYSVPLVYYVVGMQVTGDDVYVDAQDLKLVLRNGNRSGSAEFVGEVISGFTLNEPMPWLTVSVNGSYLSYLIEYAAIPEARFDESSHTARYGLTAYVNGESVKCDLQIVQDPPGTDDWYEDHWRCVTGGFCLLLEGYYYDNCFVYETPWWQCCTCKNINYMWRCNPLECWNSCSPCWPPSFCEGCPAGGE